MVFRRLSIVLVLVAAVGILLPPARADGPAFTDRKLTSTQGGHVWRVPVPAGVAVTLTLEATVRDSPLDDTAAIFSIAERADGRIFDWFAYGIVVNTFDSEGEETTVRLDGNGTGFGHPALGVVTVSSHGILVGLRTSPLDAPWTMYLGGFASSGAEYIVTLDGLGADPLVVPAEVDGTKVRFSSLSDSEAAATVEGPPVGGVTTGSTWTYSATGKSLFLGVPTYTQTIRLSSGSPEHPGEMSIRTPDGATRCTCDYSDVELWQGSVIHAKVGPGLSQWVMGVALPSSTAGDWTVKLAASVDPMAPNLRGWFIDLGAAS